MSVGRLTGKVALITGAARGQGRSHALRLAEEGARIVAIDLCSDLAACDYPGASPEELAETVELVEALDLPALGRQADVRDPAAMGAVVDEAIAEFGQIDIVCANAGIIAGAPCTELTDLAWREVLDVNLTGAWNTARAVVGHMIERGAGGSIIFTGSIAGQIALRNNANYVASKHGLVGLMRALAMELAPHSIRVNMVSPTAVNTPMIDNPGLRGRFLPHLKNPTQDQLAVPMTGLNALPIPWVEPSDVSNAVLYLASDEARYTTGSTLPVDAGATMPNRLEHR